MRRRRFLQTLTVGGVIGLSGCASLNPLSDPVTPPTEDQLKYIEYYPSAKKLSGVARLRPQRDGDSVAIDTISFGRFERFILYRVEPNGNGSQVGTITREEFDSNQSPGAKRFPLSTTQGGSVLLILGETPDGERYTYGAYYYTGDLFEQVAYVDSDSESNISNSSN